MRDVDETATTPTVPPNDIVVPGCRVRVRDGDGEHDYTMVTRAAVGAPPVSISTGSPVGRALLGRRPGEHVRVQTPGGVRLLTVVDVAGSAAPSSAGIARPCEARTKLLRTIAAEEKRRERDEKREERRRRRLGRREHHGAASALPAGAEMHDDPGAAPEVR